MRQNHKDINPTPNCVAPQNQLSFVGITATTYLVYDMVKANYKSMRRECKMIGELAPQSTKPAFEYVNRMQGQMTQRGQDTMRLFKMDVMHNRVQQKTKLLATTYPRVNAARKTVLLGCVCYMSYAKRKALVENVKNTASDIHLFARAKGEQMERVAKQLEENDFNGHLAETTNTFSR